MKKDQIKTNRRELLGAAAAIVAGLGLSTRMAVARQAEKFCTAVKYPWQYVWMSMSDIGDIGKGDALILAREVYRAHSTFASQEVVNMVARLEKFDDGEVLNRSLKRASLAEHESPDLKEEWICAALCLEIGRHYGDRNVTSLSAEIIRPYVENSVYMVMKSADAFQRRPSRFKREPWYLEAQRFSRWIQQADDGHNSMTTLAEFENAIHNVMDASLLYDRIPEDRVIPDKDQNKAFNQVFKAYM